MIFWVLIGFKRQFTVSLFALIIGLFTAPSLYKVGANSSASYDELTIMTFNVRKFNKYKWIKSENIDSKISEFIRNEKPDILALQEYQKFEDFKVEYPYYYNHYTKSTNYNHDSKNTNYNRVKTYQSGLTIFSKYQIINKGSVQYKTALSSIIFVDIIKNSDTIRIYNFHLESLGVIPDKNYFGHKDSERLFKRLNKSFKIQQIEIETLNHHIKNCKYKTIIVGDLNNTAYSWVYKNLKKNRKDSFLEAGSGFGKTYSFNSFPLRIDYIFASESISVNQHENYDVKYSDHYPVMATVSF